MKEMTPERWRRVQELVLAARGLTGKDRESYLETACSHDPELLSEVREAISRDRSPDSPRSSAFPAPANEDGIPTLHRVEDSDSIREHRGRLFDDGDVLVRRFQIIRFVAVGGMGEVYEAEDHELGERVALKTIHPSIVRDEQVLKRFRREAQLSRKVTHPNVCRVFDLFRHPGENGQDVVFLSMEFIPGETLAHRLQRMGRFDLDEALPIIEQMTNALAAAHQVGVVHRDFKPDNVMLAYSAGTPRAVVMDFGVARAVPAGERTESLVTQAGGIVGTPAYMAPEQLEGNAASPATDVYSLGLVIYEMVTGERPFGAPGFQSAIRRLNESPPSPRRHVPALPFNWESAIMACLEREPQNRLSPARVYANLAVPGEGPPVLSTAGSVGPETDKQLRRPRIRSSHWMVAMALGAALLFSLFLAVRSSWNSRSPEPPVSLDFADYRREYWKRELGTTPDTTSFDAPGEDLHALFSHIADVSGLNIVVMPGVSGQVSGRYHDLPWPDVLSVETSEHELEWFYGENIVFIGPPSTLKRLWGTELLLFSIDRENADSLLGTVSPLLSRTGATAAFGLTARTAGVVVTDLPLQIEYIASVLRGLGLVDGFEAMTLNRILCSDVEAPDTRRALHLQFRFRTAERPDIVSINWSDKDVREGFSELAQQAGLSLRLQRGVEGDVSFQLVEVPAGAALSYALGTNGLEFSCDGPILNAFSNDNMSDYATKRVFSTPDPMDAKGLASAVESTFLDEGDRLEALPAGRALSFTGRASTGRRVALVIDFFSKLMRQ